jgi:hypothetical protein
MNKGKDGFDYHIKKRGKVKTRKKDNIYLSLGAIFTDTSIARLKLSS